MSNIIAAPTSCVCFSAYDDTGRCVVIGSRSSGDPRGDMGIADAAWELTYALRRGVAIPHAVFVRLVAGAVYPALSEAEQTLDLINELRTAEGDDVRLVCDNPEPRDPEENNLVVCCGGWTEYVEKNFGGPSLLVALQRAVAAMRVVYGRVDAGEPCP